MKERPASRDGTWAFPYIYEVLKQKMHMYAIAALLSLARKSHTAQQLRIIIASALIICCSCNMHVR